MSCKLVILALFAATTAQCASERARRAAQESAYSVADRPRQQPESAYSIPKRPTSNAAPAENVYSIRVPSGQGFVTKSPSDYEFQRKPAQNRPAYAQENVYTLGGAGGGNRNQPPKFAMDDLADRNDFSRPESAYSLGGSHKNDFSAPAPPAKDVYSRPAPPTNEYSASIPSRNKNTNEDTTEEIRPIVVLSTKFELPSVSVRRENIYRTGDVDQTIEESPKECEPSQTTYNEKSACKGQLLFEDSFDYLNPNKWTHDILMPTRPDYEFVAFIQSENNTFINNGILHIIPTLTEKLSPENVVRVGGLTLQGCNAATSAGLCNLQASRFNILPPVLSSRMKTRQNFSFRYGRVEIVAKMPAGDWLFPELFLEPNALKYGNGYLSGRIVVGLARGNEKLINPTVKEELGSKLLSTGCLYSSHEDFAENFPKYMNKLGSERWNKHFHNFSVVWTPESIEFFVDEESLGKCKVPNGGRKIFPWVQGSKLAPFDEEFYVTIGLGAGGIREFPKNLITGNNINKPWKNTGNKDVLTFWQDRDNWYKTWDENSHLQVDSVKVYAL